MNRIGNKIGNRKDVMNGLAKKTSDGLKKRDLIYNLFNTTKFSFLIVFYGFLLKSKSV